MKRSNQLLLALLLIIIITPITLVYAFRQMKKKGLYTLVTNPTGNNKSGTIKPYKVVHIIGYDDKGDKLLLPLSCRLHSSTEGTYSWTGYGENDSLNIYNQGDTLYIKRISRQTHKEASYYTSYDIELSLPHMDDIVVSGATLEMGTIDATINPAINLRLNGAILKVGNGIDEVINNGVIQGDTPSTENHDRLPAYRRLSINADSSMLYFGKDIQMDSLMLHVRNKSSITIMESFPVKSVSGKVSDDAVIQADMDMIRKMGGL